MNVTLLKLLAGLTIAFVFTGQANATSAVGAWVNEAQTSHTNPLSFSVLIDVKNGNNIVLDNTTVTYSKSATSVMSYDDNIANQIESVNCCK